MLHVEVIIVACAYCVCWFVVIGLSYIELRKRSHLEILSWNGKTGRDDFNENNVASDRGTQTQEKPKQFIVGSLHYLSIMIYFGSSMICVGGLMRMIPNFCQQWTLGLLPFAAILTKSFILLFQLQRYYLCFVQDFVHNYKSNAYARYTDSVNFKMNIFPILFYIIGIICIIVTLGVIVIDIIVVAGIEDDLYSWQGIWCTWIPQAATVPIRYTVYAMAGGSFILLDWLILGLFFATLRALWTKLRQFQASIDNININTNKNKNNNNNGRATAIATSAGIERLQWILTRIFVCCLFMEMTYLIAITLNVFCSVGTFGWCLSHVLYAFDCVINVIMTNFILQHNTKEYKRFIACLSKVCCNRQYICGFNIKHETIREYYVKTGISQNVENNNNIQEQTLDTAVVSSIVRQTTNHDITVEKSYFTSRDSKDENVTSSCMVDINSNS